MTDKVQKIREEVEIVVNRRLNLLNGDYFDLNKEADGFINEIMDIIDTMQEDRNTSDWLKELESMSNEQVKERLEKVNAWYNEQFANEEPVSEDLEEAVNAYIGYAPEVDECSSVYGERQAFKAGAMWQKEHLWKPADGNDLPEIDREVIALECIVDPTATDCLCGWRVVFAHRPNPNGWNGKSITTAKVEHYTPKTYDKGGWNIPNIAYWLDTELPQL